MKGLFNHNTLNIPNILIRTLASYLKDRRVRIRHAQLYSNPFTPQAGVPQGSVLAPLMYILYLIDVPPPIFKPDPDPNPDTTPTVHLPENLTLNLFYADDNTIAISGNIRTIINKAKKGIQQMTDWEALWRIKVNSQKSRVLVFGPNRHKIIKRINNQHFTMNPERLDPSEPNIPTAKSHIILWIRIDINLTFRPCINNLRATINTARKSFFRLIALSNRVREFLYKCYILPKIMYHYPIYSFLSRPQRLALQAIQNNCLYHFVYIYKEIGHVNTESIHVMTRTIAINHACHSKARKFYTKFKEWHPYWQQVLVNLHKPPTRHHGQEITPLDWATNSITRPIYSKFS